MSCEYFCTSDTRRIGGFYRCPDCHAVLEPMVDWIGNTPIEHGERGAEFDEAHPEACLCGFPWYLICDGEGIESMTFYRAEDEA